MKFATTSGDEWRFSVGCAVENGASVSTIAWRGEHTPTPSACIGIINGRIDVAQIDFAHEAIDLGERRQEEREKRRETDVGCGREWEFRGRRKKALTFSCREKLAKRDCL